MTVPTLLYTQHGLLELHLVMVFPRNNSSRTGISAASTVFQTKSHHRTLTGCGFHICIGVLFTGEVAYLTGYCESVEVEGCCALSNRVQEGFV